jgi:hypothetical protein
MNKLFFLLISMLIFSEISLGMNSLLSQAPRILTCNQVRASCKKWPKVERVRIPAYASELSLWVQERRLSQISQHIDKSKFIDALKERFSYEGVWLSTTSNAVFDDGEYRFVVHHISKDTSGGYFCIFDVFLKDDPLKLWLEGVMSVSDIRYEGIGIRDAYDLSYSYEILRNELFPAGLLEAHFSGELVPEEKQPEGMKKLLEHVLHDDILNGGIFWKIDFIPFIKSPNG